MQVLLPRGIDMDSRDIDSRYYEAFNKKARGIDFQLEE